MYLWKFMTLLFLYVFVVLAVFKNVGYFFITFEINNFLKVTHSLYLLLNQQKYPVLLKCPSVVSF